MGKVKDMTNQKFGRLMVIKQHHQDKNLCWHWCCRCSCGKEVVVNGANLRNGNTTSCGCLKIELVYKHGRSKTRLAGVLNSMKSRCYNPKVDCYKDYGGRGIIICDEWLNESSSFFIWSDNNGYEEGLLIDRIDNDGPYSPENCRWITAKESSLNRRNNRFLAFEGKIQTVSEWADESGINKTTITHRLDGGHAVEDVLSHSSLKRGVSVGYSRKLSEETLYLSYRGYRKTVLEWSVFLGIPVSSIYYRLRKGLPIAEVLSITKFKPGPRKNISAL